MANTALDKPQHDKPAAVYWAGHGYIAQALGYLYPLDDSPSSARMRRNSRKNVGKHIDILTDTGLLKVVPGEKVIRLGTAQAYQLLLGGGSP